MNFDVDVNLNVNVDVPMVPQVLVGDRGKGLDHAKHDRDQTTSCASPFTFRFTFSSTFTPDHFLTLYGASSVSHATSFWPYSRVHFAIRTGGTCSAFRSGA